MFAGLRLARDLPAQAEDRAAGARADGGRGGRVCRHAQAAFAEVFLRRRGSELFEAICRTREYYLTRSETALLARVAPLIAADIVAGSTLVEFGSGASEKTCLLAGRRAAGARLPADRHQPGGAGRGRRAPARRLPGAAHQPWRRISPAWKRCPRRWRKAAAGLLPRLDHRQLQPRGGPGLCALGPRPAGRGSVFIVGVDLPKSRDVPSRLQRRRWRHRALQPQPAAAPSTANCTPTSSSNASSTWRSGAPEHSRVEMHLVSRVAQTVETAGVRYHFDAGERLHTENSHGHSVDDFGASRRARRLAGQGALAGASAPQFAIFQLQAT
jgi:hypothetical protein